jgi:FkbM family methyltransferase
VSRKSYSQEGEDLLLESIMRQRGIACQKGGFYVDAGSHHPVRFSNTNLFYELGWSGLNFDPNEGIEELFEQARPRDKTFRLALSDYEGEADFYVYNEPALNGIDNDRSEELKDTIYRLLKIEKVTTTMLGSALKQSRPQGMPRPNFLNVDVEGHEFQVLKGNDWEKYRFDFLLVEQRKSSPSQTKINEITSFLNELDYEQMAETPRTTLYACTKSSIFCD